MKAGDIVYLAKEDLVFLTFRDGYPGFYLVLGNSNRYPGYWEFDREYQFGTRWVAVDSFSSKLFKVVK